MRRRYVSLANWWPFRFLTYVPGFRRHTPKRNVLVLLSYLLGAAGLYGLLLLVW